MPNHKPLFQSIFGDSWRQLPPVMVQHYGCRNFSSDHVTVEGHMEVMCKWYLKPFFWLFGTVPPHNESHVPVTVHFTAHQEIEAFCFHRIFHFKHRKPYHFRSHMTHAGDNEVMERMNGGICWHSTYHWDGEKVMLRHKGYSLRILGRNMPLPITWLVGAGNATEWPVDETRFDMCATIDHPLLGKVYEYKGQFEVSKSL